MTKSAFKRSAVVTAIALLVAAVVWSVVYINSLLPIATGYCAKQLSSAVFISNRNQEEVEKLDLSFFPVSYVTNKVNYTDSTVVSRLLWKSAKAVFRKGVGSTLLRDSLVNVGYVNHMLFRGDAEWPMGEKLPDTLKLAANNQLKHISQSLIKKHAYGGSCFAFLVLHNEVPIHEAYASGFSASSRLLGWSMAKSFTNAIVGTMVQNMGVNIFSPVGFSEWSNDERKSITPNDLLRMQSGLKWNEDYGNRSDVTQMLYCHGSVAKYAMSKPLEYETGTHWAYSSGSTNIACRWARNHFKSDSAFYAFIYGHFLNPIGMGNAILEPDASGLFVGSSYIYATARDYARFALLLLKNGRLNGVQILPSDWIRYSTTPTKGSEKSYGAGFWLNTNSNLPADMYRCDGHDGQRIFIIPSRNMAVVVLGYSPKPNNTIDFDRLITDVVKAVK